MKTMDMDITDKVNRCWTFLLFLALAVLTLALPAFVSPAACSVSAHFTSPQVDYANARCAYSGDHFPLDKSNPRSERFEQHHTFKFSMSVWAPCLLTAIAFAIQIPFLICQYLQSWFGINIPAVLAEIRRHHKTRTEEERLELLKGTVQALVGPFTTGDNSAYFLLMLARKILTTLIFLALFVVLQLIADPFSYLGDNGSQTGPLRSESNCAYDTIDDKVQTFFHNCIYPVNLILQKLFIFLNVSIIFVFLINLFDLIMWVTMFLIPDIRDRKLAAHVHSTDEFGAFRAVSRTVDRKFALFLGFDGFFLLKTINHQLGESAWAEFSILLWRKYQDITDTGIFNDGDRVSDNPFDFPHNDAFKDKKSLVDESTDNIEMNVLVKHQKASVDSATEQI